MTQKNEPVSAANEVSHMLIVFRVDHRNRRFLGKVAAWKKRSKDGYQLHDYSNQSFFPQRGQIVSYTGPPGHKSGCEDYDTKFSGGRYQIVDAIPKEFIWDILNLAQYFYNIGSASLGVLKAALSPRIEGVRSNCDLSPRQRRKQHECSVNLLYDFLEKSQTEPIPDSFKKLGLTDATFESLKRGWRFAQWHQHCASFGIPPESRGAFFAVYHWSSVDAFEKNPFGMLAYCNPEGCETIWKKLQSHYPERQAQAQRAMIWMIFYKAGQKYHTSVSKGELLGSVWLHSGMKGIEQVVRSLTDTGYLHQQGSDYQLRPIHLMESEIARQLNRLNDGCCAVTSDAVKSVDWKQVIAGCERRDFDNKNAVDDLKAFEAGQMLILSGEAGTGKTQLSIRILDACLGSGWRVWVVAVSNIAVSRVRREFPDFSASDKEEPSPIRYSSVARFLKNGISADYPPVIVMLDEASMLGSGQWLELLGQIRPQDRLLVVGDPRQIPPIGWGAVFHAIQKSPVYNRIELTQCMRQQAKGRGILDFLKDLSAGMSVTQAAQARKECIEFVEAGNEPLAALKTYLIEITNRNITNAPIVLCLRQEDVAQVNWMCRQIRAQKGALSEKTACVVQFRKGEPILNTRNIHELGLWNGSRGKVVLDKDKEDKLSASFESHPKRLFRINSTMQHAYAVTVHRAQGESYKRVILYLGNGIPDTLLHQGSLYTAITRARLHLSILASATQFDNGYARPNHAMRTNSLKLQALR